MLACNNAQLPMQGRRTYVTQVNICCNSGMVENLMAIRQTPQCAVSMEKDLNKVYTGYKRKHALKWNCYKWQIHILKGSWF